MSDPKTFTAGGFRNHVGSRFRLVGEGVLTLELLSVDVYDGAAAPRAREPFALLFGAPGAGRLPQRIYRLDHPALGAMELFLTPVGDDRLEAVFS